MPCWPDIWEHIGNYLPTLGILAILLVYVAFVVLLLWAPKVRNRWLLITSRLLGVAGFVPLIVVLPAMLFALALAAGDPHAQTSVIESPTGEEAKLIYQAGFLGRDKTSVTLKQTGSCQHTTVFWHAGPSWFSDLKVD